MAERLTGPPGRTVLVERRHPGRAIVFTPGSRSTPHLRHEHKYGLVGVEAGRRFYFRGRGDSLTGAVAANLAGLQAELDRCDEDVLRHHCPAHDFSSWVEEVFHEGALASRLREAESAMTANSPAALVEATRLRLVAALQACRQT